MSFPAKPADPAADLAQLACDVRAGHVLSAAEISAAAAALATEGGDGAKEAFLLALADRGETAEEVAGLAAAFRVRAIDPGLAAWAPRSIDVVGTGGDSSGTFNISTAAVFVVAAAGVPVIKHGNRSITSRSGSADLLAVLGMPMEQDRAGHERCLQALGFTFLYAPAFHPAFRAVGPVRRSLAAQGRRTVFNLLGPLLNPARPAYQVVGVYGPGLVPLVAGALDRLGLAAALALHGTGEDGQPVDEITPCGPARVAGAGRLAGLAAELDPRHCGVAAARLADLRGGDAEENARRMPGVLRGEGPPAIVDAVCLNAGAALWVAGVTPDWVAGVELARETMARGSAFAVLQRLRGLGLSQGGSPA